MRMGVRDEILFTPLGQHSVDGVAAAFRIARAACCNHAVVTAFQHVTDVLMRRFTTARRGQDEVNADFGACNEIDKNRTP